MSDSEENLFRQQLDTRKESTSEDKSGLVEGPWAEEIHRANLETLSKMNPEEILKEKERLHATLDANLIEFIKTRKKKKIGETEDKTETKLDVEHNEEDFQEHQEDPFDEQDDVDLPEPSAEIIRQVDQKGWVHMDTIEAEKLKWMEEIATTKDPQAGEPYNARFDFNGKFPF